MTSLIPTILTIGNFDGLHLGHRHLIQSTVALARSWGGRAVLMTFTPHPKQFFHPTKHFFLHPPAVKEKLFETLHLDDIVYLPFAEIRNLSPEDFFNDVLMPMEPAAIVLGDNFAFGKNKSGDILYLRRLCASQNVALHSLPRAQFDGAPISSSRIRADIQNGKIETANDMLGAPYTLYGSVQTGARRGHTLGFATANITADDQVLPKIGVYMTRVDVAGEYTALPAVTAVTQTPTFGCVKTVVETHILGSFDQNIYGKSIAVKFCRFMRDEIVFPSKDELIKQLSADCLRAEQWAAEGVGMT